MGFLLVGIGALGLALLAFGRGEEESAPPSHDLGQVTGAELNDLLARDPAFGATVTAAITRPEDFSRDDLFRIAQDLDRMGYRGLAMLTANLATQRAA